MSDRKIVPYRKSFRPNLAFFIFIIIIIYLVVLGWNYLTREHISIYEVNTSDISDDAPIYGFVMREEEVVASEGDGYINYYNAEGSRIKTGSVVYTVDKNGEVNSLLENLQSKTKNAENISAMREAIASFRNSFSLSSYGQVSAFKYAISNVIFEQSRGSLYSDLNHAVEASGSRKNFTKISAKKSGVISYSVDGYETIKQKDITPKLFEQYGMVSRQQLQKNESIKTGAAVYRLITSNDWSIVVKLDDSYYEALKQQDYIPVSIVKDHISFNASVELFEKDGVRFAKLGTSRFMERYMNDRFLEIEFHLKSASGLKIPNSSILTKDFYVIPESITTTSGNETGIVKQIVTEDGKISYQFISLENSAHRDKQYYVSSSIVSGGDILRDSGKNESYIVSSKEPVSGVYCVNQGYCEFCPIDIRYQNKEYTIISDTTKGGLSAYDHIVVDPTRLKDDDFIK